jgi:hypothetical protein
VQAARGTPGQAAADYVPEQVEPHQVEPEMEDETDLAVAVPDHVEPEQVEPAEDDETDLAAAVPDEPAEEEFSGWQRQSWWSAEDESGDDWNRPWKRHRW